MSYIAEIIFQAGVGLVIYAIWLGLGTPWAVAAGGVYAISMGLGLAIIAKRKQDES